MIVLTDFAAGKHFDRDITRWARKTTYRVL